MQYCFSPNGANSMSFVSAVRVALNPFLVNKGRSMLTSLGIVIGISAVFVMVSGGWAYFKLLHDRLQSVGKNLILIRPGSRTQQGLVPDFAPLKIEDAQAIRKQVGPLLLGVAESQMTQRIVSTSSGNHGTALVGSTPDLKRIRNWNMAYGNFYTEEHVQQAALVCLLGQTVRKKLFPNKPDPIGENLRIGHVWLRIIGVLEEKGRSPTGADQDDQIFLPITTLQRQITHDDKIAIIVTATESEALVKKAKEEIIRVMREQHHLEPGANDDFDVSAVQEMAELALILNPALFFSGYIALVAGGIGALAATWPFARSVKGALVAALLATPALSFVAIIVLLFYPGWFFPEWFFATMGQNLLLAGVIALLAIPCGVVVGLVAFGLRRLLGGSKS
jgi:putative ABC transport system permease protein